MLGAGRGEELAANLVSPWARLSSAEVQCWGGCRPSRVSYRTERGTDEPLNGAVELSSTLERNGSSSLKSAAI